MCVSEFHRSITIGTETQNCRVGRAHIGYLVQDHTSLNYYFASRFDLHNDLLKFLKSTNIFPHHYQEIKNTMLILKKVKGNTSVAKKHPAQEFGNFSFKHKC